MKISIKGVVVKEVNYGESDKILTVLTAEDGIISVIAKRCRNLKNKNGASPQLLSYCSFLLYESKRGYVMNDCEVLEVFWGVINDLKSLSLAQYFCELSLVLSPESPNSADFLKIFLNCIFYLSNKSKNMLFIKSIFEMRSMSLCGYIPNLVSCNKCKKYNPPKMKFYINRGIIVCGNCSKDYLIVGHDIAPGVLLALRHIIYSPNEKLFSFKISDESLKMLSLISEKYVVYHLGYEFKSLNFYKSLY